MVSEIKRLLDFSPYKLYYVLLIVMCTFVFLGVVVLVALMARNQVCSEQCIYTV